MSEHILVVEDEPRLNQLLKDYLENSSYRVSILDEGTQVVSWVKEHQPDLILLDLMLPGKNGVDICRDIRSFSNIPIMMTTAKVEEIDRLIGLEVGADDYVCKPYSPREVVARVRTILRRVSPPVQEETLKQGDFTFDIEKHQVFYQKQELQLTPSEFDLFQVLLSHPGRVFSRNDLLEKVMGYQFQGYDRTIDSHIKNLRKKLQKLTGEKNFIQAVYGIGYKFNSNI